MPIRSLFDAATSGSEGPVSAVHGHQMQAKPAARSSVKESLVHILGTLQATLVSNALLCTKKCVSCKERTASLGFACTGRESSVEVSLGALTTPYTHRSQSNSQPSNCSNAQARTWQIRPSWAMWTWTSVGSRQRQCRQGRVAAEYLWRTARSITCCSMNTVPPFARRSRSSFSVPLNKLRTALICCCWASHCYFWEPHVICW